MISELMFFQFTTVLFMTLCLAYCILDIPQMLKINKLRRIGKLETKKGTYTFTPKEKTTNE